MPLSVIAEITELVGELQEVADGSVAEDLRAISARLSVAIRPLYGSYVTSLLEANRRSSPGGLAAILQLLGPFLDQPIPSNADDIEEWQYRRWLAGKTDGLSKAQEVRFKRRMEISGE